MCTRYTETQGHHTYEHSARASGALGRKRRVFRLFAGVFRCRNRAATPYKWRMAKGFSLIEMAVTICIAALLAALWLPRAGQLLNWIAADHAARDITTALAHGRQGAVLQATRARVTIAADTLRIDRLGPQGWEPWWRRPGPTSLGVQMEVSNPVVIFGPNGMGWSASNTMVVLRRGSQVETITTSRVGRVKRW